MKKNKLKLTKAGLGFLFLAAGIFFMTQKRSTKALPGEYTFYREPVSVKFPVTQTYQDELLPIKLVIPSVAIDLNVSRSGVEDGYWKVSEDSANWGEGSGLPGFSGNQVIFAHARDNLFKPLKDVQMEGEIYVFTKDNWYQYQIEEIREVFPDQLEVIEPSEDEQLTLYTCSGFANEKRLIVRAKRIHPAI